MKGVVFTEFLELVEDAFPLGVAERIVDTCDLPSGGVYTAVGTYDHKEIVQLVVALSKETGVPVPDLVFTFGKHLFGRFQAGYPQFFEGVTDAFTFLERVDGYIHVEVRKLYPDAELPVFRTERPNSDTLVMTYISQRGFGKLAEGLIAGCCDYFGEKVSVATEQVDDSTVRFTLVRG